VTMNIGTTAGGGITRVGDCCRLMTGAHVGHDCDVGDDVTLAENVALGGHASVRSETFFGSNSAVHQFVRVGEGVMVGGVSGALAPKHIPTVPSPVVTALSRPPIGCEPAFSRVADPKRSYIFGRCIS
jgi:acyl-[acyl carrier protein]--UDP-N-acetylglucosamine O-acyltransferase